ncbi:MAG: hypothetical protein GDA49_07045 [Rhodospirillales bacterium]|nr:hypothetical protein [Rhodospirillales bacterium]
MSNESFDNLVLEARKTFDTDLRRELYREIQNVMRDKSLSVMPVFTNWLDTYSTHVKDLNGHPHGSARCMYRVRRLARRRHRLIGVSCQRRMAIPATERPFAFHIRSRGMARWKV